MFKKLCFLLVCLCVCVELSASVQQMSAERIESRPKVDGIGDDEVWQGVPLAFQGFFTQMSPDNLQPSDYRTELKIAYSDDAFYVLARMYDPNPRSIPRELGLRDQGGKNADVFSFILDTYNKGQNAFYFGVTAAGVQLDTYLTPQGGDRAWDAVWESAVTFDEEGWTAEFEIPYSAIRFAKKDMQTWGINFVREVKRDNEESSWSPVSNKVSGFVNQAGVLYGLQNVDPPTRLQFFPYVSSTMGHYGGEKGETSTSFGGGMDIKFGLSESFTLDMSLIPDFSQVQSDNLILNLGPYEVKYDENRPFFTEGTDLFNKGGLFYSRRVGQVSRTFNSALGTEKVVARAGDAQLLNASKISGRTDKGLGVGFFNAVTDKVEVELEDTLSGKRRTATLDPITNFNVMVLDQNLKNNSNISLINTNVTRFQGGRDANVTATDFRFHDKNNMYRLQGFGAYSHINPSNDRAERSPISGYRYSLRAGKVSGNITYGLSRTVESDTYEINDLGFLRAANEISHDLNLGYNLLNPYWIFNRFSFSIDASHESLYNPKEFTEFSTGTNFYAQLTNFWSLGGNVNLNPGDSYDYFEPQQPGYLFTRTPSYRAGIWVRSDSRKPFAVFANFGWFRRQAWGSKDSWFTIRPRLRVSDQFSIRHQFQATNVTNERGFVRKIARPAMAGQESGRAIVFGNRDRMQIVNESNLDFIFTNKMGVSLRLRHYWSKVNYDRFFELQKDGSLTTTAYSGLDKEGVYKDNINFNTFNIDLVYNWQVAPGSFLTFAWKNAIVKRDNRTEVNFAENLNTLAQEPQFNNLSLKLTYFIDYPMLKRWM